MADPSFGRYKTGFETRDIMEKLTDYQRANRLANDRKYPEAFEMFIQHAETHPEDAAKAYTRAGECARHINILKEPVSLHPGMTLISEGDAASAERMFRLALMANPKYSKAMKLLAAILPASSDERLRLLEQAVAIQPDYLTLLSLGDYHRSVKKDYDSAYKYYLRAKETQPRSAASFQGCVS